MVDRISAVEDNVRELKQQFAELGKEIVRLDSKIEYEVRGLREQHKTHAQEMSKKIDKVLKNTECLSVIEDKPQEFLAKWNYLGNQYLRSMREGDLIRKLIYGSVVSGGLLALWQGIKYFIKGD